MVSSTLIGGSVIVFALIGQYTVLDDVMPGHKNATEYTGIVFVLVSSCALPIYQLIIQRKDSDNSV